MKTVELSDATRSLADYAREAASEMVVVTENGKPVAALLSTANLEGLDVESLSLNVNPRFQEVIRQSRERHARDGGLSPDEMRRRLAGEP